MGLEISVYPLMGPLERTGWSTDGGVQGANFCWILNSVKKKGTGDRGLSQLLCLARTKQLLKTAKPSTPNSQKNFVALSHHSSKVQ